MALPVSDNWRAVDWNGTVFCAVASGTSTNAATSPDGLTWTLRTLPAAADWRSIAWNGTVFCAVAWGGTVAATSPDGITWTLRTLPSSSNWTSIIWNGTVFCAVAWGGTAAATSADGITWTAGTLPSALNWVDVAWNGTAFCAIANGSSSCATSADGITWTAQSIGYSTSWRAISAGSSGFVAIANGTDAARWSADGITWYARYMPSVDAWWDLEWDGSNFTAIAYSSINSATISPNAMTTTARSMPSSQPWYGIAWNGTIYCAVSAGTVAATSTDGISWITAVPPPPSGIASAPTSLTVVNPSGSASAPTLLSMIGSGTASAATVLAMVDASQHWPVWGLRVVVDGVDISTQLKGQASVDAEEGAARIASISIIPPSGIVAPLDYVGKTISIDYLQTVGGSTVARRVFTGRIDTPRFNPNTSQLDLSCVDDLQNRVAELDRSVIDALVGGKYSTAVQGDILDNWDYAQARLTTVLGSLDADANGGMRVTPWALSSVWATFGDADLKDQTRILSYPQRSTLINKVEATFDYRYPRLRQRYGSLGWSGTIIDMAPCGYQYPKQQDILGAAAGSGWTVTQGVFYPAPASIPHSSGGFIYPETGSIDMAILHLAQRHSQTVTETFTLTVSAPESVAANGELPATIRGALASSFDGLAWESALDVVPLMPTGGDMDYAPDAPRADADYAIETLLEQAQVKILGSHRSARVGNACLCNPDLDLDKKVAIATTAVNASGKVARVRHLFDLTAGSAVTEFELACYGVGGAGLITPSTLASPAPPAEAAATQNWPAEVPSLFVNTFGVTPYSDGLMGLLLNPPESIFVNNIPSVGSKSLPNPFYVAGSYPVTGFRVQMPGVSDADRNPIQKTVVSDYSIIVPTDTMTFTVP